MKNKNKYVFAAFLTLAILLVSTQQAFAEGTDKLTDGKGGGGGGAGCLINENKETNCYPYSSPIMDIVIMLDSTGSMSDEITLVKSHLRQLIEELRNGNPRPDIRLGIVSYRDYPPEDNTYAYRKIDLTEDVNYIIDELMRIEASGGGDGPEAVADALHIAINEMSWNQCGGPNEICQTGSLTKKLIFLVGDAPPHGYNEDQGYLVFNDYKKEIETSREKGITIYAIGASGIRGYTHGVDIFKEIAESTGGNYEELQYHTENAQEYYEREHVSKEAKGVIESDSTVYDKDTETLQISNIAGIVGGSAKAAAMEMGIRYEEPDTGTDPDGKIIDKPIKNLNLFESIIRNVKILVKLILK